MVSAGWTGVYHCLSPDMLAYLVSLWQNAEFAGTRSVRLMHCWGFLYRSQMPEMDVQYLYIVDAYSCRVQTAPSWTKHPTAAPGVIASRTSSKGVVACPYYRKIGYHGLLSRQPTPKVYGDGALKVCVAQFSEYVLQSRVQRKPLDQITEQPGNGKTVCCLPASFCVCAYTKNYCGAKETKTMICTKRISCITPAHQRQNLSGRLLLPTISW